jgi:hypothetical protein
MNSVWLVTVAGGCAATVIGELIVAGLLFLLSRRLPSQIALTAKSSHVPEYSNPEQSEDFKTGFLKDAIRAFFYEKEFEGLTYLVDGEKKDYSTHVYSYHFSYSNVVLVLLVTSAIIFLCLVVPLSLSLV